MTAIKREGGPTIEERVAELKAEGKKEDEIKLILFEEYSNEEVMKSDFLRKKEEPPEEIPKPPEERSSFEERLKELEASEMNKHDICRTLVLEDYNNRLIVAKFGGLYAKVVREIKAERGTEDESHLGALAGTAKGEGYLDEQKARIRFEFSRDTVVMKFVVDLGWAAFLAGLSKAGIPPDNLRMVASDPESFSKVLMPIRETVCNAIKYYQSDAVSKVEGERDEARAAYTIVRSQLEDLAKGLTPGIRLERMITAYLLSGNVTPEVTVELVERWINMEEMELRKEAIPA